MSTYAAALAFMTTRARPERRSPFRPLIAAHCAAATSWLTKAPSWICTRDAVAAAVGSGASAAWVWTAGVA